MEQTDHDIHMLIVSSAQGDAVSCKKLYELLVDKVFAYVRSRTSTTEQATDITQDVFIDFFSTLSNFTYQTRAQFYAYVFVITKRKLARVYAEGAVRREHEVEMVDESIVVDAGSLADQARNTDIGAALSVLDAVSREVVVLHHWGRYTFPEIAEMLDLGESAVRVRHHRALKVLGAHFTEVGITL